MSQFEVHNASGIAFEPLALSDLAGMPAIVTLCKATFAIADDGALTLADEQRPVSMTGEHYGEPGTSSIRYEPEVALLKPSTDVVLVGDARAPKAGAQAVDCGLKVGPVQKIVRVFGDRYWVKSGGSILASKPAPFERIPLIYERAFGGWDKADKDEANWRCDRRNPVGRGFGDPLRFVESGKVPLPNLEDPKAPIGRYGDHPAPVGFGFVAPDWEPRVSHAGTYDESWNASRKPLLPEDFDPRFFNAAASGLVTPRYLAGDEDVAVVNASPVPQLRFRLPGVAAPLCRVELRRGRSYVLDTKLDTVIIDTNEMILMLLWRAHMTIRNGPQDVVAIDVSGEIVQRRSA